MNTQHNQVLIELRVIARIGEGGRISTTGHSSVCIEQETLLQPFWRMISGDNREHAVKSITNTIAKAFDHTTSLMENELLHIPDDDCTVSQRNNKEAQTLALRNLNKSLSDSIRGIANLCLTYKGDIVVVSKLEILMNEVETQVQKVQRFLDQLAN